MVFHNKSVINLSFIAFNLPSNSFSSRKKKKVTNAIGSFFDMSRNREGFFMVSNQNQNFYNSYNFIIVAKVSCMKSKKHQTTVYFLKALTSSI